MPLAKPGLSRIAQVKKFFCGYRKTAPRSNHRYILICGWSCNTTFSKDRWTSMPPL
jgi:hypothetical protein